MLDDVIVKKLEQMNRFLEELEEFSAIPYEEFIKNIPFLRASERDFQLIVDLAGEINTELLLGCGKEIPDGYRRSFLMLGDEGILPKELAEKLAKSVKIRNILVHEYEIEEDIEDFYTSAKNYIQPFHEYIKTILAYGDKR